MPRLASYLYPSSLLSTFFKLASHTVKVTIVLSFLVNVAILHWFLWRQYIICKCPFKLVMAPATRSPFFISAALLSRKPSGSPRSLKRGRSPSPDDEAKPTVARREKKKLKLLTIGKPSANRQRLLQLLHRQKKVLAAPLSKVDASFGFHCWPCHSGNAFRKQVLNVVPSSFPSEGSDPVPNSSAKTAEETFSLDFFTPAQETSITEVQKGRYSWFSNKIPMSPFCRLPKSHCCYCQSNPAIVWHRHSSDHTNCQFRSAREVWNSSNTKLFGQFFVQIGCSFATSRKPWG